MNKVYTFATTKRVLTQLRHDKRTLALVLLVPSFLLVLLKYVFELEPKLFNTIAPMLLGIFPFTMMFLITSIATLRERTTGTLDRLMTSPMSKLDFIYGYAIAFSIIGVIQASIASLIVLGILDIFIAGSAVNILIVALFSAFLGTSLGLLVSAFATTEFQAVQLVMPIVMPQVLLCGLIIPRDKMAEFLQTISDFLPLTYVVDAMRQVATSATWDSALTKNILIIIIFAISSLVLGSITIRRQEK